MAWVMPSPTSIDTDTSRGATLRVRRRRLARRRADSRPINSLPDVTAPLLRCKAWQNSRGAAREVSTIPTEVTSARWIVAVLGGFAAIGAACGASGVAPPIGADEASQADPPESVTEIDTPADDPGPTPAPAMLELRPDGVRRAGLLGDLPPADPAVPALLITPGLDVPNPFIIVEDGRYLMYSSQTGFFEPSVALRESSSLGKWDEPAVEVLPVLPAWASPGHTWAPDVRRIGERYLLYFTARVRGISVPTQCIGLAVADHHAGPFAPIDEPLVCQLDRRGSIDPRTFLDVDGVLWLHWKSDDNADIHDETTSTIYAQRMSADGMALLGEPARILEVDQPWEGRIVEAPDMQLLEDQYWLFYSGNWFNQPDYAIGAARCDGPAGPCSKPSDGPLISSNAQGSGPGEASLLVDLDGFLRIAYAPASVQFETHTPRPVALARIGLRLEGPFIAAP
jgi:hypothetical protein